MPSTPSRGGTASHSISKECMKVAKNRNKFDFAKFSPMHFLLPGIEKKIYNSFLKLALNTFLP